MTQRLSERLVWEKDIESMNQDDGDGEVGFEECGRCVCRLVIKKN